MNKTFSVITTDIYSKDGMYIYRLRKYIILQDINKLRFIFNKRLLYIKCNVIYI